MSSAHRLCESVASTLSPITLTPRLSKSGLQRATYPSSVVQTGVKSLGWENKTAQLSPIHSWKRIGPSVVSASKSGAISPSRRAICISFYSEKTDSRAYAGKVGMRLSCLVRPLYNYWRRQVKLRGAACYSPEKL